MNESTSELRKPSEQAMKAAIKIGDIPEPVGWGLGQLERYRETVANAIDIEFASTIDALTAENERLKDNKRIQIDELHAAFNRESTVRSERDALRAENERLRNERDILHKQYCEVVPWLNDMKAERDALTAENERLKEAIAVQSGTVRAAQDGWRSCIDENTALRNRITEFIGFWRAASNVMSEAEGDGPTRSSLRHCAKQLEEALNPKPI